MNDKLLINNDEIHHIYYLQSLNYNNKLKVDYYKVYYLSPIN